MMEMILQSGRPQKTEGRTAREMRTYEFLDALQIPYQRLDHESAETMEICRAIEETLGAHICKNLFLCNRQGTSFYLLMMPGDKVFKTKELSAQIGSARLSFAGAERMAEYLDILPGSVSVLGLMNDREHHVQLLIDEDLLARPDIGVHPCVNTASLCLKMRDVLERFLPATGHTWRTVRLFGESE